MRRPLLRSLACCAIPLAPLITGCVGVGGDGERVQRHPPIRAFTELLVRDSLVVEVSAGAPSASVEGEQDLVDFVRLRVRGDQLDVSLIEDDVLAPELPLRVRLTTPALEAVVASEASVVRLREVATATFAISAREGSIVEAEGAVTTLILTGATVADVDTRTLRASDVEVRGYSAASMMVFASREVRGTLTENAKLAVLGGGKVESLEITRDAEVHPER